MKHYTNIANTKRTILCILINIKRPTDKSQNAIMYSVKIQTEHRITVEVQSNSIRENYRLKPYALIHPYKELLYYA